MYIAKIVEKSTLELFLEIGGRDATENMYEAYKHLVLATKHAGMYDDTVHRGCWRIWSESYTMSAFRDLMMTSLVPSTVERINLGSSTNLDFKFIPVPRSTPGDLVWDSTNNNYFHGILRARFPGVKVRMLGVYLTDS